MRAGIEAGGTKVVCAVGTGPDDIADRTVIPTTTPDETLAAVGDFLLGHDRGDERIEAVGIVSFGPLDLHPGSPSYGCITTTPKSGWAGTDLVAAVRRRLDVPVVLDTDVNGAGVGEHRWGAGRGLRSLAYLTVGTGIGGGAVVDGRPLHGLLHPEMGHLHADRHPDDDFVGSCPFHGGCLEGLASGPAVAARTGRPADEPGAAGGLLERTVRLEAWYLAQLVCAATYVLSPERIVLGGGVLQMPGLLAEVRRATVERLAGALDSAALGDGLTRYLVAPALGSSSGVLGALALAEQALDPPTG